MSAEQLPQPEGSAPRFAWSRRRPAPAPAPQADLVTHIGGTAVDPVLTADPLDVAASLESGVLHFSARLTTQDGAPLADATVLFTIVHAARTTVKCAALTDDNGVARTESMLPQGLFDRGPIDFRVGFAGAPPQFWPVSVAGQFR